MKAIKVLSLLAALTLVSACGGSSSSGSSTGTALRSLASCTAETTSAVICGTVYAPDGSTPVEGAEIKLDAVSASSSAKATPSSSSCVTDESGKFYCAVDDCEGTATFYITGSIFSTALIEFTATCTVGGTEEVPTTKTTATSADVVATKWLVIPGSFDGIQMLLAQLKSCTLDSTYGSNPESLRGSPDCEAKGLYVLDDSTATIDEGLAALTLADFQAIFVNCGANIFTDEAVKTQLQNYVNTDGGNIYFSDWAQDWLEELFPDAIDIGDNNTSSTDTGTPLVATVDNAGLATFLGSATVDIDFNLGGWYPINSVTSGYSTFISGDISSLASEMTGIHPITVGGAQGSGCIFYTSYHVETGVEAGAPQEKALKYLVLNKMDNCN